MAVITSRPFGITKEGNAVTEYVMTNKNGMQVCILDRGCILRSIIVPSKKGPVEVCIGHDTLADYEADDACSGAFVGRVANRIENAVFTLNGKTYQLEKNKGEHHIHGCFKTKQYTGKVFGDSLMLEAMSPDGEDGFPGNMKISVRYMLTDNNSLSMEYRAVSDADTLINLTNHSYFNLNGEGDVLDQKLKLYCSKFLEGNEQTCPTGRILPVSGTPMDFTQGKLIGQDIHSDYPQVAMCHGYDHCYVIDREKGSSQSICAWASSDKTGISMKVYTTQPGVQFYTGNFMNKVKTPGHNGAPYIPYGGFALETQHYPCTPSHPDFPSIILRAGKVYRSTTTLRFFTGKQCGSL